MKDKELRAVLKEIGVLENYNYPLDISCKLDDPLIGIRAAFLKDRVEKLELTVASLLEALDLKEIEIKAHSEIVRITKKG